MHNEDQLINLIRDEFNRLHARLDEHFETDHKQDAACNQHLTEWKVFKWVGSTALATVLAWVKFK